MNSTDAKRILAWMKKHDVTVTVSLPGPFGQSLVNVAREEFVAALAYGIQDSSLDV